MRELYRKQGAAVRWENGTVVRVSESGYAIEDGEYFECGVADAPPPPLPELDVEADFAYERLIDTRGVAHHQFGEKRWSEETKRVHCALTQGSERALIDLAAFDFAYIKQIATILGKCSGERAAPPRLRFAPSVTAALLPSLVGLAPPNVRLAQQAGGIDGKGNPIVETEDDWPNWFRPSYRIRPVRMPLDLKLTCDVTEIDTERPVAVALLAPVQGLVLRVLVDDGERPFAATVRVTRIDAVAHASAWYPYGGGSFGAELML